MTAVIASDQMIVASSGFCRGHGASARTAAPATPQLSRSAWVSALIGLKVLTGAGAKIDTTTANGRLAFGIFAAFAEFERELIAERTQAGLAAARARGRMGGRPRKMDKATLAMAMAAMSDRNAIAADVARRLGMTTTTLYMYVNGDGTPKAPGQALLDGVPYRKERLCAA